MKLRISTYTLITYGLFIAVFKPYFLPNFVRVAIKIFILAWAFLFIISKTPRKKLLNYSLVYCTVVLLSSIAAIFRGNYGVRDVFDSLLYILSFYDLYTFSELCYQKGKTATFRKALYEINLLYCILTVISILLNGVENNSNQVAYLFGNKFTSMYLFILLISLYGCTHDMNQNRNKVVLFIIFTISIAISLYVKCATATVTLVCLLAFLLLPSAVRKRLLRPSIMVILLVMSAVILIWIKLLLKIDFIDNIVSGFFHKSYTVTGRLQIYGMYLVRVILGSFWLGYGYSNSFMQTITGVFANAQNGLLEIFVSFGLFGVIALISTVFHCYKHSAKNDEMIYLSLVVLGMIIAAIFEVTLNWFFILGLCLIRWNPESTLRRQK